MSTENYDNTEHNPAALSKRILGTGWNPETSSYKSFSMNSSGHLHVEGGFIEIARGNVAEHNVFSLLGHKDGVGTGADETVWGDSGVYAFPAAATTMTVSSSDANDTSAGSGARTVLVSGLDADYVETTESITMSGQSGVTTANSYLRINNITVTSSGTTKWNEGVIYVGTGTITAGKPANVYRTMEATYGISHDAVYTVPAGKTFYLMRGNISVDSSKDVSFFIDQFLQTLGGTRIRGSQYNLFETVLEIDFKPSAVYPAKSDIVINAQAANAASADVAVNFAGLVIG